MDSCKALGTVMILTLVVQPSKSRSGAMISAIEGYEAIGLYSTRMSSADSWYLRSSNSQTYPKIHCSQRLTQMSIDWNGAIQEQEPTVIECLDTWLVCLHDLHGCSMARDTGSNRRSIAQH